MQSNLVTATTKVVRSRFAATLLASAAVLGGVATNSSAQVTFFDAGGFEAGGVTPYTWPYAPGGLSRHTNGNPNLGSNTDGQWLAQYQTPTTALFDNETDGSGFIQGSVVNSGAQALQVTRNNPSTGAQRYFYGQDTLDVTGVSLTRVTLAFTMRVDQPTSTGTDGPFFGVEAKGFITGDINAGTPYRLGALGVNAGTRELIVFGRDGFQQGNPSAFEPKQFAIDDPAQSGIQPLLVNYGQWYSFELIVDYSDQSLDVRFGPVGGPLADLSSINKDIRWAEAFGISNVTRFGDADIIGSGLETAGVPEASGGTAYFDDFSVTAVPEPTVMALLAGATGLLLRRRR
jgi:hypothetical protein